MNDASIVFYAYLSQVLSPNMEWPAENNVKQAIKALLLAERVFVIGNGGSAATAMHFVNDLIKYLPAPIRAMACTNTPLLTAYANDCGYDLVFQRWLEPWGVDDQDVVFAITTSGVSENILRALVATRAKRIVLTAGGAQCPAALASDVVLLTDKRDIKQAEDVHMAICHGLIEALADALTSGEE